MFSIFRSNGIKVAVLCLLWYIVSATNNIIGKITLNMFPYPMTVTIIQLSSTYIYLKPILFYLNIRQETPIKKKYFYKMIIPIAFGKFCATLSSHVSLWKVPVSYTHTIKSTMPLFVVFLARIINGETQTFKVYISLVPIVLGVSIASVTELSFDLLGLLFALLSTFIFSLLNITSKNVLDEIKSLHHLYMLATLSKVSLIMSLPIWFRYDLMSIINLGNVLTEQVVLLLLLDGFLNCLQNVIAFTVLSLVSSLTYSVCNASKRVAIITASLITLKNPITIANVFGMILAISGVLLYNKAQYEQKKNKESLPLYANGTSNGHPYKPLSNGHPMVYFY